MTNHNLETFQKRSLFMSGEFINTATLSKQIYIYRVYDILISGKV